MQRDRSESGETPPTRVSAWGRALRLADQTPTTRNRYVDFLRAASIGAVVFGHWLVAAPFVRGGDLQAGHLLSLAPWSQWLTWGFQVMPIFFMVGGFANSASWEAARRERLGYPNWLGARLRRLTAPVVPFVLTWSIVAVVARLTGVDADLVGVGSQVALVPLWFLAVYVGVVAVAPATLALWRRMGWGSFAVLAGAATLVDVAAFGLDWKWVGWANFGFVWLAVHQLGYGWREGRFGGFRAPLWGAGGLAVLVALVLLGPYPISMVGVPGDPVTNTLPPTVALVALGIFQTGTLLAVEGPARRWLSRRRVWASVVIVNASIMTIYLWHLTAMVAVAGLSVLTGGWGLGFTPLTAGWWAVRPLWLIVLVVATAPLIALFAGFEQRPSVRQLPSWRPILGTVSVSAGMTALALGGIVGSGPLGVRLTAVVLTVGGGWLVGVGATRRHRRQQAAPSR